MAQLFPSLLPTLLPTLTRHITVHVLGGIALVLIAFLGLVSLFTLIDELGEDEVGYGASAALQYVALTLPRRTYEMLPYAAFIGALLGLGQLANHSELIVMRAAGYSTGRIFRAVCVPAALLLGFSFLLGEYVAPVSEERATSLNHGRAVCERYLLHRWWPLVSRGWFVRKCRWHCRVG